MTMIYLNSAQSPIVEHSPIVDIYLFMKALIVTPFN